MQTADHTDYSGLEELLNTESMPNYNNHIVDIAVRHARSVNQVIDFGAGIGTLSLIMREKYGIDPICIEIDAFNKDYLTKREFTFFDDLRQAPQNSDLIFSSNVLEHIEDDISVLQAIRDNLKEGGQLYLYLPARMLLWSKLDEIVGHYRRYELAELRQKCEAAGLKVEKLHYADCGGFFASLLMKCLGYNAENGIGSVKSLKFYDRWLFPISRILDRLGFKHVIGKNLVLVASKPPASLR